MSSIPQKTDDGNSVSDFATKFMKRFHLGKLLFKCNAGKEQGIPVMDIFRFLFCMMFSDRSVYMQMKTGTFEGGFSKNTIYRFLNDTRTNWQRFTTLLSADIINGFMKPLTDEKRKDVFIVDDSLFDRSRSKKTELVIISTDTELSEEEIIRIYGKRWDIEVFFKACKSYLNLVKEYRGISYDAMNAHTAIVFSRYMMLSVVQRENTDDKTICELCFCLLDEMEDITFSRSMCIIIDALMDTVMEYFHITEAQLEEFTASFIQRLPKYMQEALERKEIAA